MSTTSKLYSLEATRIDGTPGKLSDYQGKVLLIVNVASQCGFTPQYEGLEAIYRKFRDRGFEILGFPCDQFGHQEPGSDSEIHQFCVKNFGVTFPLFSKIEVNGAGTHPVFGFLKSEKKGLLGTEGIKWNFTKFLVNREGEVIKRFAPTDKPEDLVGAIEALL
jgi:glutathione peroxidase